VENKLTEIQLAESRRRLSTMSIAVMDAYRSAYSKCRLEGDKVPPARSVQTLCAGVEGDAGMSKTK